VEQWERGAVLAAVEAGADAAVERRERGAAVEAGADAAVERGRARLPDEGVHVAVDAVGSAATAEASVRSLRPRGRHVQVGLMLGNDARAPLPWDLVVARELEIRGSHGMPAADYPSMLAMVADGRLRPGELVGTVIRFEQVGAALMAMDSPVAGNAGITVAVLS
jgi:alcohol dehydrogenase